MAAKKNPGRFTIQFNTGDPQQQVVCDLLEQQGRHKAQFLTAAVLHYIHCPETPEIVVPPPIDSAVLESMVLDILERHRSNISEEPTAPPQEAPDLIESPDPVPENNDSNDSLLDLLGPAGLSAIQNTLSAFQQG